MSITCLSCSTLATTQDPRSGRLEDSVVFFFKAGPRREHSLLRRSRSRSALLVRLIFDPWGHPMSMSTKNANTSKRILGLAGYKHNAMCIIYHYSLPIVVSVVQQLLPSGAATLAVALSPYHGDITGFLSLACPLMTVLYPKWRYPSSFFARVL